MLKLPDVTLVIAETRAHDLARVTINDLVSRVQFGDILIYSDDCWRVDVPGARYVHVKDWPDKITSGRFYYTQAAKNITTSHALLMEWDAGLNYPEMWDNEFLKYDFIGAPWPAPHASHVRDGLNVGNGGFMLLSKRLIDFIVDYPIATDLDISCKYRREIEQRGRFHWAPESVAERFAFEGWTKHGMPVLDARPKSFGYHGVFNWRYVLSRDEIAKRAKLMLKNDFIRDAKYYFIERTCPWLKDRAVSRPHLARPENAIERARQQRARQRMQMAHISRGGLKA